MRNTKNMHEKINCPVCGLPHVASNMVSGLLVRPEIVALIKKDHPDWTPKEAICKSDLNHYRALLIEATLEEQHGELSELDRQVIEDIRNLEIASQNINENYQESTAFGDRISDKIASFGGSWTFIISFLVIIVIWIGVNVFLLLSPFDAYPFILLNLLLSCVAALQAPVIMMSQNRQETKDRLRAEQDYRINLKAELEIRALHEKLDYILLQQWERILDIQQVQIEILDELTQRNEE